MTRKEGSKNLKNKWTLKKTNDDGKIEETTFKTQKDIAEYLNLSISVVKKYTCVKSKCKLKHKTTKKRWNNISIFKIEVPKIKNL